MDRASAGSGARPRSIHSEFEKIVRSGTEWREQQAAAVQKESLKETSRVDEKKNDPPQRKPRTIFQRVFSRLRPASNASSRARAQHSTAIQKERLDETSRVDEETNDQSQDKPRTIFQRLFSRLRGGNSDPGYIRLPKNPVESVPQADQAGAREGNPKRTVATQAEAREGEPKKTVANMPEKDREDIRKGKMHDIIEQPRMEKMQTMDSDSD